MIPNLNRDEHTFEKWQINKLEIQEMPSFGHASFIKELEELYKLPESYFAIPKDSFSPKGFIFDDDGSVGAWANSYCSTYPSASPENITKQLIELCNKIKQNKESHDKLLEKIFKEIDYKKNKKYIRNNINYLRRQFAKSKRKGKSFPFPAPIKPKPIKWKSLQEILSQPVYAYTRTELPESRREDSILSRMILANMFPPITSSRILLNSTI